MECLDTRYRQNEKRQDGTRKTKLNPARLNFGCWGDRKNFQVFLGTFTRDFLQHVPRHVPKCFSQSFCKMGGKNFTATASLDTEIKNAGLGAKVQ